MNWQQLYIIPAQAGQVRTLMFPDPSNFNVQYGLDPDNNRCLLFFPVHTTLAHSERSVLERIRLTVEQYGTQAVLAITLTDINYAKIFDGLIQSIYNQVRTCADEETALRECIRCYNDWTRFFTQAKQELSENAVKGIIGELMFINHLLDRGNSATSVITAWKGPSGGPCDFAFDNGFKTEVKSRDTDKNFVDISSGFQLDYTDGEEMHLAVYTLEAHPAGAIYLSSLVNDTVNRLNGFAGAPIDLFWQALKSLGADNAVIFSFDDLRFNVTGPVLYDCRIEGFPSIRQSQVNDGISQVRYRINLSALDNFRIN